MKKFKMNKVIFVLALIGMALLVLGMLGVILFIFGSTIAFTGHWWVPVLVISIFMICFIRENRKKK